MAVNENILARRYAKGLALVASERGIVPTIQMQFAELAEAWKKNESLMRLFADHSVADSHKLGTLEAFIREHELRPELSNFIRVLARRNRLEMVGKMAEAFREVALKMMNTLVAAATFPRELRPEEESALRQTIEQKTGKNVILHTLVDPSIIGGGAVRIGSRVVDGSVRARLEAMRQKLITEEKRI